MRRFGHAIVAHDIDEEMFERIAAQIDGFAEMVDRLPPRRRPIGAMKHGLFTGPPVDGASMDHFPDCIVSGQANPMEPAELASVTTSVVRTDKEDPASHEEAVAVWRMTLKDPDEAKVGRAIFDATVELSLSTIPGFFGVGGSTGARPYGVFRPAVIPGDLVPQHVVVLGGGHTVVDSVAPGGSVAVAPLPVPSVRPAGGETVRAAIGLVVGARSGDKGGNANLGVFTRTDEAWAWLDGFLTTDKLAELLPETAGLDIDRYRLPALRSLNFVVRGLLQEGVAASTRQDGQAKSLGEWLRARVADVPVALLPRRA
jgi:hypothetical protein